MPLLSALQESRHLFLTVALYSRDFSLSMLHRQVSRGSKDLDIAHQTLEPRFLQQCCNQRAGGTHNQAPLGKSSLNEF